MPRFQTEYYKQPWFILNISDLDTLFTNVCLGWLVLCSDRKSMTVVTTITSFAHILSGSLSHVQYFTECVVYEALTAAFDLFSESVSHWSQTSFSPSLMTWVLLRISLIWAIRVLRHREHQNGCHRWQPQSETISEVFYGYTFFLKCMSSIITVACILHWKKKSFSTHDTLLCVRIWC